MKHKALRILAILGVFFGMSSAQAYKMSGIDGYFQVTPGVAVTLTDDHGQAITIHDGAYRLRLSVSSSSINFMDSDTSLQVMKVNGGFPNNDLRNFNLPSSKTGQQFDIRGVTEDISQAPYTYRTTQSCSYVCGYTEVCTGKDGTRCRLVKEYCNGREQVEVTEAQVDRNFTMSIQQAGQNVAEFKGTVSTSVDRLSTVLLSGCY